MWTYEKKLQYPVKIKHPNPAAARIVITQLGGPDGELGAANRYLSQRFAMPYDTVKGVLTDVGISVGEMSHFLKKRTSLIVYYAKKHGKSIASRKYQESLSNIKRWCKQYDGTWQSLLCKSRRPHSHPKQHTLHEEADIMEVMIVRRRKFLDIFRFAMLHS